MTDSRHERLNRAAAARRDEFYTRWDTVDAELRLHEPILRDASVYCPADTADSMFVRWLAAHFNRLGLKRLTATSYAPAQTALFGDDEPHTPPMLLDLTVIPDGTADRDRLDVDALARIPGNTVRPLDGDGDFRSMECRPYWQRANIVASNPPWSLYRDFMRLVRRHRCLPLVLGPLTGVAYRDILPMLADGRWRVGVSVRSGVRFTVPDSYPRYGTCTGRTADGRPWIEVNGARWIVPPDGPACDDWPAIDADGSGYEHYDNLPEAIDIPRMRLLPARWDGPMGVPVTFLDRYSPERWRIIGIRDGADGRPLTIRGRAVFTRLIVRRLTITC